MYSCCIFDLDGTLLDTVKSLQNTVNATLAHFGLGPVDEAHIKAFVGEGYKVLLKRALTYCGDEALANYEQGLDIYMKEFAVHAMDEVKPYAGIAELLEYLRGEDIRIAVLSNKPHEKAVSNITDVFGEGYFDYVAGEQEGVNRKPDPAGLYLLTDTLNVKPSDCLYVGDTGTDMQTGIAAGADTIGVLWGFRGEDELAAYQSVRLVREPGEIIEIVKQSR